MSFTSNNDFNPIQNSDIAVVGAGAGDDTYRIGTALSDGNKRITISDIQGTNSIQLADGLKILSSQVSFNAVKLVLDNGAEITILGADNMGFEPGGDRDNGIDKPDITFTEFVTSHLGIPSLPASGIVVTGGPVTISSSINPTFSLTTATGAVNEGNTASWLLTLNHGETDQPYSVTLSKLLQGTTSSTEDLGAFNVTGNGITYDATTGLVTFASGATTASITQAFKADSISPEFGEGVTLSIKDPTDGAQLSSSTASIAITNVPPAIGSTFTLADVTPSLTKTFLWDGVDMSAVSDLMQYATDYQAALIANSNDNTWSFADFNVDLGSSSFCCFDTTWLQTMDGWLKNYATLVDEQVTLNAPMLTTIANQLGTLVDANGVALKGTIESGFTTANNDTIVAGTPYTLQGAYIDGGAGYNTLIVEMKGPFAQPKQLLNIQEVRVSNLTNYYESSFFDWNNSGRTTTVGTTGWEQLLGELVDSGDSILDLTTASSLEKIVVTEAAASGDLYVLGLQNYAVARFEGNFHQDATLHYGAGQDDVLHIEMANVTSEGTIGIAHNAGAVELKSDGYSNILQNVDFGSHFQKLTVTGAGVLAIEQDLKFAWGEATIDASANTGGLRVVVAGLADADNVLAELDSVTIKGSQARDAIEVKGTSAGAVLNIDTGAGADTVTLYGVDAGRGSILQGDNLTVNIKQTDAEATNLTYANISGVDQFVLDAANGSNTVLIVSAAQIAEFGLEKFIPSHRDTDAHLKIVVTESTTLSDLLNLSQLDSNIKLEFDIAFGATLTMSAEELHQYVAEQGIVLGDGAGESMGKLVITDAGMNFDPTDNGEVAPPEYPYSLGGTIVNGWGDGKIHNLTVIRSLSGWDRESASGPSDSLTLDTTEAALVIDANALDDANDFTVRTDKLIIEGENNITFNAPVDFRGDFGDADHDGIIESHEGFTVDFRALAGNAAGLTLMNFQNVAEVIGNGGEYTDVDGNVLVRDVRINIQLDASATVGAEGNANGLKTSGVQTYVVTSIGNDRPGEDTAESSATIYLCDQSQDVVTVGLQGNYNDTLNVMQANWGVNFLLEGDGSVNYPAKSAGNPNWSNVGTLNAEYFYPGATAVVNINNQGTDLTTRSLHVEGINIGNAKDISVYIEDGNAIIKSINNSISASTDVVENLTIASANNVTLQGNLAIGTDLKTVNADDVAGTFTFEMTDNVPNDLSGVALSGIDAIVFNNAAAQLTLSVDQINAIGATHVSSTDAATGATLNVTELSDTVIDLSAIDVANIGTVYTVDTPNADDVIVLADGTHLGGADKLVIVSEASDTILQMTAAQFHQICGEVDLTTTQAPLICGNGAWHKAELVLTNIAANDVINLAHVDQTDTTDNGVVEVTVRIDGITATSEMKINGGVAAKTTLEVAGGTNDLTKADLASVGSVHFTDDATLTLTAAQVAAIEVADFSVADGVTVTLNVTDLSDQVLNLDAIAAAGIDIGNLYIANTDGAVVLDATTTLGGADSIVTPTWDSHDTNAGIETTTLKLTAAQFNQLNGNGTITGGATVNITDLVNNTDVDHVTPLTPDTTVIDVSDIAAPKGTVTLGASTVTLDAVANLSGFDIQLNNGQMIEFNTAVQASGAHITEASAGDTTAVAWLFDDLGTLKEIDTTGYAAGINTLYINENLVDGENEEALWNFLPGSITVEKVNLNDIPDVLIAIERVNTFEALASIDGVSYNDTAEFQTISKLTLNLEGNTSIGDVGIGDSTPGSALFAELVINSYEDRSTLPSDNGFTFQPNKVGDISLNTGTTDELVNVKLNTGTASTPATTDSTGGLALEVGTIKFAATTAKPAVLTLTGANAITIEAVDLTDAEVSLLKIDATAHTSDLTIGDIQPTGGTVASNVLGSFDHIYVVDGHTAATESFGDAGKNNLLVVKGGVNDLTQASTFDIDQVHFTADGSLTLTAQQVASILQASDTDTNGVSNAWSALADLKVKLNIVDYSGQDLNLNAIAAAGIDVGTITVSNDANTTTGDTSDSVTWVGTLGDADSIIIPGADTTVNISAAQFDQLAGTGTITGAGTVNITNVHNTLDDADADAVANDYTLIDVSAVTAVQGTITLDENDVTLGSAAVLGQFSITLNDVDSATTSADDVAGQTIRFTTAVQAERTIWVENADGFPAFEERDTNVIWLFDAITGTTTAGKINTAGYDPELGRVWVNDALVDGENVESIFSSPSAILTNPTTGVVNLNSSTIIRIVNTADLDNLIDNQNVSRVVEIEAFTALPTGLTFNNTDKLVSVDNLTLTLGGDVTMGALQLDNVLAAPTGYQLTNNDEFGTLTINSYSAAAGKDYLYPETWVAGVNPATTGGNVIGAISSGTSRGELSNVTINAADVALTTGIITFVDDGGLTPLDATDDDPTAILTVTGSKNVTIASVNTVDTDITALNVVTTSYNGTLTAPGTSPAFMLDNTNSLTFTGSGTINLGDDSPVNAGVAGNELSAINASGFTGTLNLGILAQLDSTNDDSTPDTAANDGLLPAFTFNSGQGITTATLAAVTGQGTPTLNAGSEWTFDYTGADAGSYLKITSSAVFNAGATLRLTNVPLQIEGTVNLSTLVDNATTTTVTEGLFITGNSSIEVLAGSTLTLTAAQANGLTFTGAGAVIILPSDGNQTITSKTTGNDTINAGAGDDIINAGAGADNLTGGAGADTFNLANADTGIDTITDWGVGGGMDAVIGSLVAGGQLNVTIADDSTSVFSAAGIATTNGVVSVTGGAANDFISGGAGADTLSGGAGTDRLSGGGGADALNGGAGVDTFAFAAGDSRVAAPDRIASYESGVDVIDHLVPLSLGGDSATAAVAGNANIDGSGKATFAASDDTLAEKVAAVAADLNGVNPNLAGKVAFFEDSGNTYVFVTDNTGTNTTSDDLIELTGVTGQTTINVGTGDIVLSNTPSFTVTVNGTASNQMITYGGNASGDVTVTHAAGILSFTRGGVTAVNTATLANLAAGGIPAILGGSTRMTDAVHDVVGLADKLDGTVTIIDTFSGTGGLLVDTYVLASADNNLTLGAAAQNVSGGVLADTVNTGVFNPTGTLQLGQGANVVNINNGQSIAGANITALGGTLNLMLNGAATMTAAQYQGASDITAVSGADSVTITTAGAITADADVETYTLVGASNLTVNAAKTGVNITGENGTDQTVTVGGLTVIGTYALGTGTDTIVATNGANIAGVNAGAATTAETLNLAGGITMTQAQLAGFTAINDTDVAATPETITLTTAGAITADADVETYVLAAGANTFATAANGQTLDASALTDTQSVTVTGNKNITVTLTAGDVNASAATGIVTVDAGTGSNTITTGDGADVVVDGAGNDNISTGAGDDFVDLSLGNDMLATGDGADSVRVTLSGTDTVNLTETVSAADAILILNTNALDAINQADTDLVTVSNFNVANDSLTMASNVGGVLTATSGLIGGFIDNAAAGAGVAAGAILELSSASHTYTDVASLVTYMNANVTGAANSVITVVAYDGAGNAALFQAQETTGTLGAFDAIELVGMVNGVALNSFTAVNFG